MDAPQPSSVDDLLDEVDDLLNSIGEEFAHHYTQANGQ